MKNFLSFKISNPFIYIFLLLSISSYILISNITKYSSQFSSIISRNLEETENKKEESPVINPDLLSESTKICKRASENLNSYFTDIEDTSTDIDISEMAFSQEEKEYPEYIQVLKDYIIQEKTILDILLPYGIHILPIVVFFVLGILSIIGWVLCCVCCCCCNCCCCCCCKKSSCKVPCFFFNFVFYVVIAICALFLSTNNSKFFNSIGDVSCSFAQFFNQIENGEKLDGKLPKWKGMIEIKNIFNSINAQTEAIKKDEINNGLNEVGANETAFIDNLDDVYTENIMSISPGEDHYYFEINKEKETSGDSPSSFNAVFDFVKDFGPKEEAGKTLYKIEKEMIESTKKEKSLLTETNDIFQNSLRADLVRDKITTAKNSIDEFQLTTDELYTKYFSKFIGYTEYLDSLGRVPLKIAFIGTLPIIVAMGVLLIFLNIFGTSCCSCCKCALGPIKFFLHLFWNLLAIIMIASFLWGSMFCFIGVLGKDVSEVLGIIFGEENLATSDYPIVIQGNSRTYYYTCIHGQGDFMHDLNLLEAGSSTESIQKLYEIKSKIQNFLNEFKEEDSTISLKTYDDFNSSIKKKSELKDDTNIFEKVDPITKKYSLFGLLDNLNFYTNSASNTFKDLYTITGTCSENGFQKIRFTGSEYDKDATTGHKNCISVQDFERVTSPGTKRYENINTPTGKAYNLLKEAGDYYISEINKIISEIKTEEGNINILMNDILVKYRQLVIKGKEVLTDYIEHIDDLLKAFEENLVQEENSSVYDFLKCKFVGKNMLIIMKYLKENLGKNLYKSGILVIFFACCLAIAIMFTALEIAVVDISVEEAKKIKEEGGQKVEINNSEEMRAKNNNNE